MKSWSLYFIAGLMSLYSCDLKTSTESKDLTENGKLTPQKESRDTVAFIVDTFKIPDDIEGCGYYFSPDEQSFKAGDFIFVANKVGVGYISVNNTLQKLKLTSTTRTPEKFGDHLDIYTNSTYKVTVDIKYGKKSFEEETWTVEGTLLVETKDGRRADQPFFGDRGC